MRDFEDPLKNPDQLRALATVRGKLLAYLPWFVQNAAKLDGVQRIALFGSITTDKEDPRDIDFLVTVTDEAKLEPLARLGRKLKGPDEAIWAWRRHLFGQPSRKIHRAHVSVARMSAGNTFVL